MSFDSQFLRKELPVLPAVERVECAWVRCNGYRCLAFRDKSNVWRGYYDHQPLEEPIEILQVL